PSVHRGADRGRTASGRKRLPPGVTAGGGAGSRGAAERVPLPSAVSVRVRPLPARRAAAAADRRGARRRVLAAGARGAAGAARGEGPPTRRGHARRITSKAPAATRRSSVTRFRIGRRARLALVPAVALATATAAYGATSIATGGARAAAGGTLVVDRSFEIKTSDPQRAFEPTAAIVDRAVYDTLLTYKGGNIAHPVPLLAASFK